MNSSSNKQNVGASAERSRDDLLERLDAVVHRFGRLMSTAQAGYGRDTGLPAPQYMVLRILLSEGEMRVSDIASTLGVKNPAASGLVQSLEEDGLVERRSDESDHRVVLVRATARGKARFTQADQYRLIVLRMLTSGLPTSDVESLVRMLDHMADVVASGPQIASAHGIDATAPAKPGRA